MNIYTTLFLLLLFIYSFLKLNWNRIAFISILSAIASLFYFEINGVRILFIQLICFLFLPITFVTFKKKTFYYFKFLYIEIIYLFLLALIYIFIIPWETNSLIWSQRPFGRSIISLTRFIFELSIIIFFAYIIGFKKVKITTILNYISILILISCIVAFFDKYFLNYTIIKIFFDSNALGWDLLSTRLLGLSNEPRTFARLLIYATLIIYHFDKNGYKIYMKKLSLLSGFTFIIASLSLSGYLLLLILYISGKIYDVTSYIKIITFSFLFSIIIFFSIKYINTLSYNSNEIDNIYWLVTKAQMITSGGIETKQIDNEPIFFTSFELFDRIALNHLYNDPKSLLFGTGPNLINIPASKYIDKSGQEIYGDSVNMIPGIGLINLLSRSGIVGIILFIISYFSIKKCLIFNKKYYLNKLNFLNYVSFFTIMTPFFYIINGIILGIVILNNNKNNNDINNYSSI